MAQFCVFVCERVGTDKNSLCGPERDEVMEACGPRSALAGVSADALSDPSCEPWCHDFGADTALRGAHDEQSN